MKEKIGGREGEFRTLCEYTHTLRLKSELFDLRAGYANSGNEEFAVGESELKPARLCNMERKIRKRRF